MQIDTLSISILPGQAIKQFTAYDPFAKWTVARPYKRATAKNAAEFLDRVRAQMPDPVRAIQIDGVGVHAEFEKACADAKIPLYLLPPRSPKLNGAVERCNELGGMSSTPAPTCPSTSTKSLNASTPSKISTITTDPTALAE